MCGGGGGGVGCVFFFFKQKTAYEIVSRDWSSDVSLPILGDKSSDLSKWPQFNAVEFKQEHTNQFFQQIEIRLKLELTLRQQCANLVLIKVHVADLMSHYTEVEGDWRLGLLLVFLLLQLVQHSEIRVRVGDGALLGQLLDKLVHSFSSVSELKYIEAFY